ncbi:hypothetical protein AC1031_000593 [Aphanomyces cochlioides]|nr:hypothetical protein AC1031_000593 [Aphanomyces cochlioides]
MTCSCSAIVSIIVALTAVSLSSIALGLPLWSCSTSFTDAAKDLGVLGNVKFSVGVWGFCLNADYDIMGGTTKMTLDQCFAFYSPRDMSNALKINGSAAAVSMNSSFFDTKQSLCDLPIDGSNMTLLTSFSATEYSAFMTKTCGSLGKSSLAFAVLSSGFGALTLISLLFFITCCSAKSCFVTMAKVLALLAFASSAVAFCCWIGQTRDINRSTTPFSVSFAFEIAATALYLLTFIAITIHQKKQDIGGAPSKGEEESA